MCSGTAGCLTSRRRSDTLRGTPPICETRQRRPTNEGAAGPTARATTTVDAQLSPISLLSTRVTTFDVVLVAIILGLTFHLLQLDMTVPQFMLMSEGLVTELAERAQRFIVATASAFLAAPQHCCVASAPRARGL